MHLVLQFALQIKAPGFDLYIYLFMWSIFLLSFIWIVPLDWTGTNLTSLIDAWEVLTGIFLNLNLYWYQNTYISVLLLAKGKELISVCSKLLRNTCVSCDTLQM